MGAPRDRVTITGDRQLLRFDERVAIVTGAGGTPSLGRAYAHLFAARGARVVVNDLGVGSDGSGTHPSHPKTVVDEIRAAGGDAVADTSDISSDEGVDALVGATVDRWGRIDILVNNAGVAILAPLAEITPWHVRRSIDVHVMGTILMTKAVWPQMASAGYGRIVNTTSGAMLGERFTTVYGAAKGGILSFTRGIAAEGADVGIKANAILPAAHTTATTQLTEDDAWKRDELPRLTAEQVAPVVAYLAHADCPVSGKCIGAVGGHVWETYFARTDGVTLANVTMEAVAESFAQAVDRGGETGIPDPADLPHAAWTPRRYVPRDG